MSEQTTTTGLAVAQAPLMDATARDRYIQDGGLVRADVRHVAGWDAWTSEYWFDDGWHSSCEPGPGRRTPHYHQTKRRALMCACRSWRIHRTMTKIRIVTAPGSGAQIAGERLDESVSSDVEEPSGLESAGAGWRAVPDSGFSVAELLIAGSVTVAVGAVLASQALGGAREAQVQTVLHDATVAAVTWSTDNGGSYDGLDEDALENGGFLRTPGVDVRVVAATPGTFVLEATSASAGEVWTFDSSTGRAERSPSARVAESPLGG